MSDYLDLDGVFINSLVGEGTRFDGDISLHGLLRIDGDFRGAVNAADKVLIGKNGRAECSITAGTVVVGGILKGDIVSSEKVVVLSSGMVIGNITTPRLVVEEGVILNGACTVLGKDGSRAEADIPISDQKPRDIDRYNPIRNAKREAVGENAGTWQR
ncbi:bactofilin family protein [Sediminispirochaeta bajacaliforniensis]|uniref:bactofilin family protein n=1 Tax=Sediminispirochaeta bajacaliforniensis TaxID=148 RepID=UPI000526FA64|nr:polymer-forming cytoskeletal protein [Sediminispirochaeta bajacaliforniensis]